MWCERACVRARACCCWRWEGENESERGKDAWMDGGRERRRAG